MDVILYALCKHCVGIINGWLPFPSTAIANQLDLRVGKVRYHLKKLKEQGLVESCRSGGQTDEGKVYCINGFTITDKARETSEYKKAFSEERKICKKIFDIDI